MKQLDHLLRHRPLLIGIVTAVLACVPGVLDAQSQASNASKHDAISNQPCPQRATRHIYTPEESGEVVPGPACVGVKVNALRYGAVLGLTVTYTAGPDLSKALAVPDKFGGNPATATDIAAEIAAARVAFINVDALNLRSSGTLADALATLKSLVSRSDDLFSANGAAGVVQAAHDAKLTATIESANALAWRPTDAIYLSLRTLQGIVNDLLLKNPSTADKDQLTLEQSQIATLLTDVATEMTSSDKTLAFQKQAAILQAWKDLIAGISETAFEKTAYVSCGVLFNQNKQVAVRLLKTDRLPMFDGTALTQTDLKDPFVTVSCASPFNVSAGVEFSFLKSPSFGIVPSGAAGANQFAVTDEATINPMPIAMIHGRLAESADHKFAVYASFGVAAHVQGSASGSSTAEFLAGPSIGLFRTIFVTPGWHIGKVASLNGGYKPGDAVPTGVTVAPVKSSYTNGFGLAITFTKP